MPTGIANTLRRIKAESNEAHGAAHNGKMDRALHAITAALAELDDAELRSLIAATHGVPQTAPHLFPWIEHACDWELHRRNRLDFPLRPPEEDAVSIDAANNLRAMFAQGSHSLHTLFDALAELLAATEHKHSQRNPTP